MLTHDSKYLGAAAIACALLAIFSQPVSAECYGVGPGCPHSYSEMMDIGKPSDSLYQYQGPDYSSGPGYGSRDIYADELDAYGYGRITVDEINSGSRNNW